MKTFTVAESIKANKCTTETCTEASTLVDNYKPEPDTYGYCEDHDQWWTASVHITSGPLGVDVREVTGWAPISVNSVHPAVRKHFSKGSK